MKNVSTIPKFRDISQVERERLTSFYLALLIVVSLEQIWNNEKLCFNFLPVVLVLAFPPKTLTRVILFPIFSV